MANLFRAGVGRSEITPPLTAPHASWGAQVHVLPDGVDAPLWVTALVVDDGETKAAWIDIDIVIITRRENDAIREEVGKTIGIPPLNVRVSVTHNHAGPPPSQWNWTKQGQAALDGYFALLPEYAAGAARAADLSLQPARIATGSGSSRVAVNRREDGPDGRTVTGCNFNGVIDPEVFVVRIDGVDSTPIAALVGYTMHPTTLGPNNRVISPDWPGFMKRTVESLTGATCLFAQGSTGDVGPGRNGFTHDANEPKRLGAMIGCEAARVYLDLDLPAKTYRHDRVWESGAPLSLWVGEEVAEEPVRVKVASVNVDLPLLEQPAVADAQAAVDAAQARLDSLKAARAPAKEIEAATFVTKRSNMALNRALTYGGRSHAAVEVHVLQIGPAVIAGTEGEPFCEIGMAIKERSPFAATWFGGYTSGWAGYIPTASEYRRRGYEVDISPFAPEAEQALVEGAVAALEKLARP